MRLGKPGNEEAGGMRLGKPGNEAGDEARKARK